jgi:hypothetical protein
MIPDHDLPASQVPGTAGSASSSSAAKVGPGAQPVSAAENPLPPPANTDSPADAQGRRILSTAFVRVGPDGLLTVSLRDGSSMVLRDVKMGAREYCGLSQSGGKPGTNFCGRYADVAEAKPGAV